MMTYDQVCHFRQVKCNPISGGQVVREIKPKALSGISVSQTDNKHGQYQLQDAIMKAGCEQLSWVVVRAQFHVSQFRCLFRSQNLPCVYSNVAGIWYFVKRAFWRIWSTKVQKQCLLLETLDPRFFPENQNVHSFLPFLFNFLLQCKHKQASNDYMAKSPSVNKQPRQIKQDDICSVRHILFVNSKCFISGSNYLNIVLLLII